MATNELCFFVSDLHGKMSRYDSLIKAIIKDKPALVFIGGDLLPHPGMNAEHFVKEYIPGKLRRLKQSMGSRYPLIIMIPGNDDPALFVPAFKGYEDEGLWKYLHSKTIMYKQFSVTGYAIVPPTPFQNKDWEKYDVSRYVDPGCIPPDEGFRTVAPGYDIEYSTIYKDLESLSEGLDLSNSIFLMHTPPHDSQLDRAALDGIMFDNVPMDVHVGSIAVRRFIDEKQPFLCLHGHIHESTRLTGHWQQRFGDTLSINAAHDGPELCLMRFDLNNPGGAMREMLV